MKRTTHLPFFLLILLTCSALFYTLPAYAQDNSMKKEILRYINQHRTDMGLHPLTTNSIIEDEALTHSNNMAKGRIPFGHDGFDDRMGRIMKQIKPSHAAAENVAEGARTAREVVDIWLHSPGHRKNIEGNYTLTGIGIATDRNGKLFFTQIFILNK